MAHRTIHYIATKDKAVRVLQQYCDPQDIDLIPLDREQPRADYLMIIEPVQIGPDGYTLSKVWKPWLLEKMPKTRLIVASYAQSTHSNALNLLNLPASLHLWLDALPPVGAFLLQHSVEERQGHKSDVFSDPWEWFLPMSGRDMKKQMEKFIEGHDKTNSFANQISRLRKKLMDIRDIMEAGVSLEEKKQLQSELEILRKDARKEWEYLLSRWHYYENFFEWMPFRDTAEQIQQSIEELKPFMKDWLKPNTKPKPEPEKLDTLRRLVKEGLDRYIYAEDYW